MRALFANWGQSTSPDGGEDTLSDSLLGDADPTYETAAPEAKAAMATPLTVWFAVVGLFVVAGVFEIGGGWLVWQWRREKKNWSWGLGGAVALVVYGLIPTFQPSAAGDFGRVYAAYGCYFIFLSLGWAWLVDDQRPDLGDALGAAAAAVGAALITFWPR